MKKLNILIFFTILEIIVFIVAMCFIINNQNKFIEVANKDIFLDTNFSDVDYKPIDELSSKNTKSYV